MKVPKKKEIQGNNIGPRAKRRLRAKGRFNGRPDSHGSAGAYTDQRCFREG